MNFGNEVPVHSKIKSWLSSLFQLCHSTYRFCLPINQCKGCQMEHWWDPWTLSSSKHLEHKYFHLSSNMFFTHSSLCDSLTSLHFCFVSLSYKYSTVNALGCVVSSLWWFHIDTKTDSHQRYQQKVNTTMCVKDCQMSTSNSTNSYVYSLKVDHTQDPGTDSSFLDLSKKRDSNCFTMTGIGQWWFWFITIKSVMTKVLPCLDLTCRLRFQMTTEPLVAAEASMCSKNNKIIQFTKATKNRKEKVALRLKKKNKNHYVTKTACIGWAVWRVLWNFFLSPGLKVLNL